MQLLAIIGALIGAGLLIRVFTGMMNVREAEESSLASVEARHPYFPRIGAVGASVIVAGVLFALSLKYGKNTSIRSLTGSTAAIRTLVVFLAIAAFGMFDQSRWHGSKDRYRYLYAFVLGTLVTWILIAFKRAFFETGLGQDPFLTALGMTCIVIGWKFLFGRWSTSVKSTVLGTFIFWSTYAMLRYETGPEILATAIAAVFAVIPAVLWCWLFLGYHRERLSVVLLAFFAGMLSTAPILFYAEIARRGMELNFFVFKVVPINYGISSREFVSTSVLSGVTGTASVVLVALVTYLWVGIVEEVSKFWVLRKSSREFFRSIDDALQLSIVVALGFAFAENLVNPSYFTGFVRQYLLLAPSPQWGALISSIFGRAVLTTMVHVLSTGVLGYFFGLAFFATPLLRERFREGKTHPVMQMLHRALDVKTETVFKKTYILAGLLAAIVLHGVFDFTVSLPEVLPGNPGTVGALLGLPPTSFLHGIGIVLLPALLYVAGGFWLLGALFERKEDMKEFGAIVESESFVS